MYVDSSPATPRRSTPRRTRLADAVISQWLLDQVPAEHRHLRGASRRPRKLPVRRSPDREAAAMG